MISESVTLSDVSQRYYSMAKQIEPNAMPAPGAIKVEHKAQESGRGTLVDTYV